MSGYGSMTIVLKNNSSMLSNREKFQKSIGSYGTQNVEFNLPKASPQLLRNIRERIIEDRKSRNKKIGVVFALVLVSSICFLMYLLQ